MKALRLVPKNLIRFTRLFILGGFLTLFIGCGEEPKDLYGPIPDYGPVPLYGVQECTSDEQCIKDFGDGWYCNAEQGFSFCDRKDSK